MNRNYVKLELDKVLAMLANEAVSEHCREKILLTKPLTEEKAIRGELQKTDDAFTLSAKFGTPRFARLKNVQDSIKRAKSGAALSLRELLDICALQRQINMLASWYSQCSEMENALAPYFAELFPDKALEAEIDNAILSEEELSDSASPELARIRRAINKKGLAVRDELDKLLKSQSKQKYLQETLVTMRDGRYVVPVKTEYKNEISGLVHDTSSSGATLFIEPMSVVEANNEIRVLKGKEQVEIERIIRALSERVGEAAELLLLGYEAAIMLEMYFAKSRLAEKMNATTPEIVSEQIIYFKKARHPLISKDTVVPVTISLGESYHCLIVTGPNTGGKTVSLKTAGLLTLMAMCGLMIPAADGSKMGVFTKVLADIGDEQSIEQNLSTFSSHMTNIIHIMKVVDEKSLVLLDELGSGTDPIEGAALAVSILMELRNKNCRLMATTHYQEVKLFAIETDGVENASCEFDVNTLMPTYRLITGVPGKSNAFAIAKRLDMSDSIIEEAKLLVSDENKRFEKVIESLESTRQELESLRLSTEQENRKSIEIREALQKQIDELERTKEREIQTVRNKSQSIINEVRFTADRLLDELEQMKKEKDTAEFSQKVKGSRARLEREMDKLYDKANPVSEQKKRDYTLPRPLKLYDTVRLVDIDKKGTVIKLPDKSGTVLVQVGLIKTKTALANLELILEKAEVKINSQPISTLGIESNMTRKIGMELDIRGMSADEGVAAVDIFLDSSILGGRHMVTIIHGKGTGVLRNAVHQLLKAHKHVKSFRLGKYGEGEAGVTVVELDN